MKEEWRSVVGYEGAYEVSNFGQIRSLDRKVLSVGFCGGRGLRTAVGQVLKPMVSDKGYLVVCLNLNNKKKTVKVHRIVCAAFMAGWSDDFEVNHADLDKSNNAISNLEISDRYHNIRHARDAGLFSNLKNANYKIRPRGVLHEFCDDLANIVKYKLTPEIVWSIRKFKKVGRLIEKIAALFHVSYNTVVTIIKDSDWEPAGRLLSRTYFSKSMQVIERIS